jgi:salicylate hydroxylase
MPPERTLIAGAGLGGLTAAACLLKRGLAVEIHEQASQLGEVGAGIQLSANAVKVLYDLGLREALESVAVKPLAYEFRRYDTGELLQRMPLNADQAHEQRHGTPYYHVHRGDLHGLLAQCVHAFDSRCIALNSAATGFQEAATGVALQLADGRTVAGDLLIGADGIRSCIRTQIAGDVPPQYTGQAAWRAVVRTERLAPGYMDRVVTVWCGPRNHAVIYYLRSGTLLNFVGCHARDWEEESWTQQRPWEELKADYAGWHPDVQALIDALDHDQCYRWALNSRPPVSPWSTARATLLGDAVHPTLPYLAQGAAMAIEDACVLARCVTGPESLSEALQRYQRNRVERTGRIVRESAASGQLFQMTDADAMRRAFANRDLARSRAEWLYCYDPLAVPLT